jgi:membrane protease YdiL (CAAX protease family)
MSELEIKTPTENPENSLPVPSAPQFAVAHQPSYVRTLFLGPDGLRAGWGVAFYGVTFYLLQWIAVAGLPNWLWSGVTSRINEALTELALLVAAVVPAIILGRVEKRPWGSFGLPLRRAFSKLFWWGAIWGFAGITLLILALYGFHGFEFGSLAIHGRRIVKFAAYWSVMFVLVGLFEEFMFRGYSQFTLARGIGFWPSAAVLSCAFGLVHLGNGGEHWPGLLAAACIGFFFCLTLRRTGNLWFAVGFHAAWDWGETFFYSTPDSGMVAPGHLLRSALHGPDWLTGGSVGPEGSVFCFVVIAVVWIAFERTHPAATVLSNQSASPE